MAPPPSKDRLARATKAMTACGFPKDSTKLVLKSLLKVFDSNWYAIEDQNYSVLVDALIAHGEEKGGIGGDDDKRDSDLERKDDENPIQIKRERSDEKMEYFGGISKKKSKFEETFTGDVQRKGDEIPLGVKRDCLDDKMEYFGEISKKKSKLEEKSANSSLPLVLYTNGASGSASRFSKGKYKGKEVVGAVDQNAIVCFKEQKTELDVESLPRLALPPLPQSRTRATTSQLAEDQFISEKSGLGFHSQNGGHVGYKGHPSGSSFKYGNGIGNGGYFGSMGHPSGKSGNDIVIVETSPKQIDIASSSNGEVKVSFVINSASSNRKMPSLEFVMRTLEKRRLKAYKIIQPNFTLINLMREMCNIVLESGQMPKKERPIKVVPMLDLLKKTGPKDVYCGADSSRLSKPSDNSLSLVPVSHHGPFFDGVGHVVSDISRGTEIVNISLVGGSSKQQYPTSYCYIPRNIIHKNGHIDFSLARIADEDCCSECYGDCLSAMVPCACARETGGVFAYTPDGLMKKEFLDDCISRFHDPQKHHHVYCKDCPLERMKNEVKPDPCKGHLVRKFIKECWAKCGCSKQCGNRVVQRGITCNVQVFYTPGGKGWGLHTLDELPRGTFVCEYVGEILTNSELYERTLKITGNAKHTYPVLLDADWASEEVLKDEEALCLDATFFGNVARFINHRCSDSNLIEIPVQIETLDRHYYHLAFFTTRKVEAFEELTWDYGIDFDDHNHPVKAFRCNCGSQYCRDKNQRGRSKSCTEARK